MHTHDTSIFPWLKQDTLYTKIEFCSKKRKTAVPSASLSGNHVPEVPAISLFYPAWQAAY